MEGTCSNMCPDCELPEHDTEVPSVFECDDRGFFQPSLAVKSYHRSDAGREVPKSQLRPLHVLKRTLSHLLDVVIGRMTGTSPSRSDVNMYHFIRDRFRAIRQDLTYQNCHGIDVISILEPIALFHVWSGLRFSAMKTSDFDPVQNKEQLTQTLLTLDSEYDVNHTPNESLFRALHLLIYLNESQFLSRMMSFSVDLLESPHVRAAVDLRAAFLRDDFPSFFATLRALPIQLAAVGVQNCMDVWVRLGHMLHKGFGTRPFPAALLQSHGCIPDIARWAEAWDLVSSGGSLAYRTAAAISHSLRGFIIPEFITQAQEYGSVLLFLRTDVRAQPIRRGPSPEGTPVSRPRPVEPVRTMPSPPEALAIAKPKPIVVEQVREVEVVPEPVRLPSPRPAKARRSSVLSAREIAAMLPLELPPQAFATILLLASDDSASAEYAKQRFEIGGQIALCDHFVSTESDFYLLITVDETHPGPVFALNCNDSAPDVPGIRFAVHSGFDDNLAFAACLRKVIHRAIVSFAPINISALVHSFVNNVFDRIRSPAWYLASGNGVISTVNSAIEVFVRVLKSPKFIRWLVPFEHNILSFQDYKEYITGLEGLQLPFLPVSRSKQRLVGMIWVSCVKQNASLNIERFIAPMSSEFHENEFLEQVIAEIDLNQPSETVSAYYVSVEPSRAFTGLPLS